MSVQDQNGNNGTNVIDFEKQIEDLPPSAKLVFKVLEYSGFLTQKEIAKESYLPPRTVRYALNRLKDEEFLQERFYFKDARQSLYGLKNVPRIQKTNEMLVSNAPNAAIAGVS